MGIYEDEFKGGAGKKRDPYAYLNNVFGMGSGVKNAGLDAILNLDLPKEVIDELLKSGNNEVKGGYAGYLMQHSKGGKKNYDTTKPKPQKVAPKITLSPKKFRPPAADGGMSVQDYIAQLAGSLQTPDYDYETALRESEKAIRDAYKSDINAIRKGNRRARKDTAVARRETEGLYAALAREYEKTRKRAGRQGERLANNIQGRSERSADKLTELAANVRDESADLAQGLGIEEALTDLIPENANDSVDRAERVIREGADDAARTKTFTGNHQRFLQRGKVNARLEGTNRSSDLIGDLQDYLQGSQDKIASLRSARSRELAANKSGVMDSVAQMQSEADQQMWDRLMQLAGFQLDVEDTQADNNYNLAKLRQQAQQAQRGGSGEDIMPDFLRNYTSVVSSLPKPTQAIMNAIIRSDEFEQGRFTAPNGELLDLNPTAAANMAEKQARAEGVTNEQEIAMIRLAAQVYSLGGV